MEVARPRGSVRPRGMSGPRVDDHVRTGVRCQKAPGRARSPTRRPPKGNVRTGARRPSARPSGRPSGWCCSCWWASPTLRRAGTDEKGEQQGGGPCWAVGRAASPVGESIAVVVRLNVRSGIVAVPRPVRGARFGVRQSAVRGASAGLAANAGQSHSWIGAWRRGGRQDPRLVTRRRRGSSQLLYVHF